MAAPSTAMTHLLLVSCHPRQSATTERSLALAGPSLAMMGSQTAGGG
jgi:hypothetical protein